MIIVHAHWHDPVEVRTSEREMDKRGGITGSWQNVPSVPGVYAFLKQYAGAGAQPFYVGQSNNVQERLHSYMKQHNLVAEHILKLLSEGNQVFFLPCSIEIHEGGKRSPLPKADCKPILDKVEIALISHLNAGGHELINTKNVYELSFQRTKFSFWSPERLRVPMS
jgi:hypothetical protein